MAHHSGSVIESQADWLTVSAHGGEASVNLEQFGRQLGKGEAAQGNKERRWRLMGYEGTHVGRIEYGRRDSQAAILRLSGDAANEWFDQAYSLGDGVTRFDLAVTWQCRPPDPHLGRNAYHLALDHYLEDKRRARPWIVSDADGGTTCYVGARESENFLRVYNKEAESIAQKDDESAIRYKGCWRYELETKASVAAQLAADYAAQEDRSSFVQRYLFEWVQAHGIEPAFPFVGAARLWPGFRRRSDADSKLQHLERAVRPTVEWLREAGREEDVKRILGFS